MSRPAEVMPTQPLGRYQGYVTAVSSTAGPTIYVDSKASSTVRISDYFQKLADQWQHDTAHVSQISQRIDHPAYKRIVRMGSAAVPLILEQMKEGSGHWFHALSMLVDDNPIPSDFSGTIDDAAALWVAWGVDKGLISP